jgi:hypothetical protein
MTERLRTTLLPGSIGIPSNSEFHHHERGVFLLCSIIKAMIPTEHEEQANLVQYLNNKGYKHFRVPSETYTKSWNQKRINKMLGVVKGAPDLFILVGNQLIACEMKRIKGSVTSKEQKEWIDRLNKANIPARVCKGCDEAISFILEIEKNNKVI